MSSPTPSKRSASDPTLLILTSLLTGPKHGHALLLDIDAFADVRLGPGTLYGAITRLEQQGLIQPLESEGRRRPYEITAAGSETLAVTLADLRPILDEAESRLGTTASRPIRRRLAAR